MRTAVLVSVVFAAEEIFDPHLAQSLSNMAFSPEVSSMTPAPEPTLPRHIACAVDVSADVDSAVTDQLIDVAALWAKASGAHLSLLHVSPPPAPLPTVPHAAEVAAAALAQVLQARTEHAQTELLRLQARAAARGVKAATVLVTQAGRIPELLVEAAVAHGVDLLVVGSHTRRGLVQRLLGSVAQRAAQLSHIPVLLLPPERSAE